MNEKTNLENLQNLEEILKKNQTHIRYDAEWEELNELLELENETQLSWGDFFINFIAHCSDIYGQEGAYNLYDQSIKDEIVEYGIHRGYLTSVKGNIKMTRKGRIEFMNAVKPRTAPFMSNKLLIKQLKYYLNEALRRKSLRKQVRRLIADAARHIIK